ncbi:P-loop containing nucleoside triphosphate hydrolase protein [Pelagophyceae sp. CCMP2097]|nr:P-loop containing nucleoside triphosphate hydrolase protein [Pelagophyceae sp. CCMP2097]|mmetsp:Transcript_1/g.5  ORF Transcript_1/g.5 Transcript_1/m.5 type:complete len:555 (-) Transcript_1:102-1766(-)
MARTAGSGPPGGEVLVRVVARCVDAAKCPFAEKNVSFALRAGDVLWLQGPSGAGKTTLAGAVTGLESHRSLRRRFGLEVDVEWSPSIPAGERCGAMFQSTTLLDALAVGANVACALEATGRFCRSTDVAAEAKRLVEAVGLDWARDGRKLPGELSGGMARRASLALQLAQRKRVVVLDEPFTGLDEAAARTVAKELAHLRERHGTALLLISHQPHLAQLVCGGAEHCTVVQLTPAAFLDNVSPKGGGLDSRGVFAFRFSTRFAFKLYDYVVYSLPLISLAFAAAGCAIAMLSADLLTKIDVKPHVSAVLDREVLPLVQSLLGKDVAPGVAKMTKMMVRTKALAMVDGALPKARRGIYALGLVKLFVLELGPLLTALLLSGRIGGSYAGDVATMQATKQNKLLKTLALSPRAWSLAPSLLAATVAAPLLTLAGTFIAVGLGGPVAQLYGLGGPANDLDWYWAGCRTALFPELRVSASKSLRRNLVELLTWPLAHNVAKALTFISVILVVAEHLARRSELTHRGVPKVITASVVAGGLGVIFSDWAFSQLLVLRES